jgi:hypothetical protein
MAAKKRIRFQTKRKLRGWPLVSIAIGPDPDKGETRGWARGIIAIGDFATGLIAIGGIAGGGVAIGGISLGVLGVGGISLGGLVLAGVAIGFASIGGVAVGQYAKGGKVFGTHVVCPRRHDPEAVRFFNLLRLGPGESPEAAKPAAKPAVEVKRPPVGQRGTRENALGTDFSMVSRSVRMTSRSSCWAWTTTPKSWPTCSTSGTLPSKR